MKPLKRVVLKEELVELTKDYKKAILLNQFIYWSERVSDFDKFIAEEKERCSKNDIDNNQEFLNGWMYKSAEDLSEETMLGLSKSNMGAHIKSLVDNGWLSERNNPIFKWDRTKQYRVNIIKIQQDLFKLSYSLEGYPLVTDFTEHKEVIPSSKTEHAENTEENDIENKNEETEPRSSILEHASSKTEHGDFKIEHGSSNLEHRNTRNETAIPEITTETTTDIYNQSVNNKINDSIVGMTDEELNPELLLSNVSKLINSSSMPLLETEKNMLLQAMENIIMSDKIIRNHNQNERIKNINNFFDNRVIIYAIEKFRSLDKNMIKNPQGYFTSIFYNSIFEVDAAEAIKQNRSMQQTKNKFHNFEQRTNEYTPEQLKEIGKMNFEKNYKTVKNRFHNFEQRTDEYTAEELEEIGKKNLEKKLKKLGVEVKNNGSSS